jgi:hypothetical protein
VRLFRPPWLDSDSSRKRKAGAYVARTEDQRGGPAPRGHQYARLDGVPLSRFVTAALRDRSDNQWPANFCAGLRFH